MNRRMSATVAVTLTLGAVLAGCGSGDDGAGGHDMNDMSSSMSSSAPTGSSSTPATAGRAGDIAFAQGMIPHHRQAIEMADIALRKPSASPEVRKLATSIRAAQDPEIKTMTRWLTAWGAPTAMPSSGGHEGHGGGDMGGMMTPAEMASLKNANGPAFDRQWMTMMIKHHQGAVKMAGDVKRTTRNPDVRALADAIIKGQNAEIRTMQGLLRGATP